MCVLTPNVHASASSLLGNISGLVPFFLIPASTVRDAAQRRQRDADAQVHCHRQAAADERRARPHAAGAAGRGAGGARPHAVHRSRHAHLRGRCRLPACGAALVLTVSRLFIALWSTTSVCRLGLCAVCSLIQVHACVFNRASVSQSVNTTLLPCLSKVNVSCPRFAPLALPALRLL